MKPIVISVLFIAVNSYGQLMEINAFGGESLINWSERMKEYLAEYGEEGPGFIKGDCSQGIQVLKASSTLPSQGSKSYELKNIHDDNPMTAWVEGAKGYGIGEWFEVKAITVNCIYNGYQSSPTNWKNNSRVKQFKVYLDGKELCLLNLTDEMGEQRFELPFRVDWEVMRTFRFEIMDVYKGAKWDDVAISNVDHIACCMSAGTEISSIGDLIKVDALYRGHKIQGIDVLSGDLFESDVIATVKINHINLVEIATVENSIVITKDHPILVENYGFISLARLMKLTQCEEWSELSGRVNAGIYSSEQEKIIYIPVISVKELKGDFETFSILKLSKGETYIANGFVTKLY